MPLSESETKAMLFEALKMVQALPGGEDWLQNILPVILQGYRPADYFYKPDKTLLERIEDYKKWCETREGEDPGQLMEEIALLAFKCLRGWSDIKSYQSYAPQHDLVISGVDLEWVGFISLLRPNFQGRTIVVEAKNLSEKIDDQIFSRLCSILLNVFAESADIGVFFSRLGATGFPDDQNDRNHIRQRGLRDAQATQIIFHAKTGKSVVVFTNNDILKLVEPGALPRLLESKIRAIEEFSGLPLRFDEEWKEIDLPAHLKKYL
jgi:hypothetical protein